MNICINRCQLNSGNWLHPIILSIIFFTFSVSNLPYFFYCFFLTFCVVIFFTFCVVSAQIISVQLTLLEEYFVLRCLNTILTSWVHQKVLHEMTNFNNFIYEMTNLTNAIKKGNIFWFHSLLILTRLKRMCFFLLVNHFKSFLFPLILVSHHQNLMLDWSRSTLDKALDSYRHLPNHSC